MSAILHATIGHSVKSDAILAGADAAARALRGAAPARTRCALVLASSWFDQAGLLRGIRSVLGQTPLIGCSTAGEIVGATSARHSCVVMLLGSDGLEWGIGMGEDAAAKPREAGQQAAYAAARAIQTTPRLGFLLFGDGLATGHEATVRGIQEVLGTSALVVGGLAGDDLRFTQTFQYANDRLMSRGVVGLLLAGPGRIGVGQAHGFAPIGKPRRVTRARANVLLELDRQPAASIYQEYFGVKPPSAPGPGGLRREQFAYPLGIQGRTADRWMLRMVVGSDDGGLALSGEVPEHAWLQLMISNRQLALEAAQRAAEDAVRPLNHVAAALVFEAASRRVLLGPQLSATVLATIRHAVGPAVPLIGCYTYGEQTSGDRDGMEGASTVQTGSIVVVALGS